MSSFLRYQLSIPGGSSPTVPQPSPLPTPPHVSPQNARPYSRLLSTQGPLYIDVLGRAGMNGLLSDGSQMLDIVSASAGAYYIRALGSSGEFRPGLRYEYGRVGSAYTGDNSAYLMRRSGEVLFHGASACVAFSYLRPTSLMNRSGIALEGCGSVYYSSGTYVNSVNHSTAVNSLGWGVSLSVTPDLRIHRLVTLSLLTPGLRIAYEQFADGMPGLVSVALQGGLGFTPLRQSISEAQFRDARNAQECTSPPSQLSVQNYNSLVERLMTRNLTLRNSINQNNAHAADIIPAALVEEITEMDVDLERECGLRERNIQHLEEEYQSLTHLQASLTEARIRD